MKGIPVDARRAKLRRVLLEAIDRSKGSYKTAQQQDELLAQLIEVHDLKDPRKGKEDEALTVAAYRAELYHIKQMKDHTPGAPQLIKQLFLTGSSRVLPKLLTTMGFDQDHEISGSEDGEMASSETEPGVHETPIEPRKSLGETQEFGVHTQHPFRDFEHPRRDPDAESAAAMTANRSTDKAATNMDVPLLSKTYGEGRHRSAMAEASATGTTKDPPTTNQAMSTKAQFKIPNYGPSRGKPSNAVPPAQLQVHQEVDPRLLDSPSDIRPASAAPGTIPSNDTDGDAFSSMRASLESTSETAEPAAKKQKVGHVDLSPTIPKSLAASTPRHQLIKLSDEEISRHARSIWGSVQAFSRNVLSKADAAKSPKLITHPKAGLRKLYQRSFSENWLVTAVNLANIDCLKAGDLVENCVAASLYDLVFRSTTPWDCPKAVMQSLSQRSRFMNQLLVESGSSLDFEFLVWQSGKNQVLDAQWQQEVIVPEAERLASIFMSDFKIQLDDLTTAEEGANVETLWNDAKSELTEAFTLALILKGQLDAAPDYYETKWILSGVELDRTQMSSVRQSVGRQAVDWCVSPLIKVRATKDSEWKVACPAKVFTRPMPGV